LPVQRSFFIEHGQKLAPDIKPNTLLFPESKPPPAGRCAGISIRKILPASAGAKHPKDTFYYFSVIYWWSATLGTAFGLRQQWFEQFPLVIFYEASVFSH
jgi:hypothetical protein